MTIRRQNIGQFNRLGVQQALDRLSTSVADNTEIIEYADEAERNSAVLSPDMIGSLAHQLDNGTFWLLRNNSPVEWVPLGNNVFPVKGTGDDQMVYVRTTGDDTTGDGRTIATAYRTVRRALQDLPLLIWGVRYVIDCTDIGQELHADPTELPMVISPDPQFFDPSPAVPGFLIRAPVTLQATPTLVDTIDVGELTGQTQEALTGLRTLQTSKNYALDEQKGRIVRDANGVLGVIASNTAGPNSDIEVTQDGAFTAPVEILAPSAEIRNSDVGGSNAFELRNSVCRVQFNGIKFSTANPSSFRYGLLMDNPLYTVGCTMCQLDGVSGFIGSSQPSFSTCQVTKRFGFTGLAGSLFNCLINDTTISLRNGGVSTDVNFWFENIIDGCSTVGGSTGIEETNRVAISMDKIIVRNGTADGIFVGPLTSMRLRRTRCDNNAGDGVEVQGANRITLLNVSGTGNTGLGLRVTDAAQANLQGTVDITGVGGDYKVGGNAIGTWGAFSGDENDLGAGTSQLCRMFV